MDAEWYEFQQTQVRKGDLKYLPSKKSDSVEKVRLRDYDRPQPEVDEQTLREVSKAADWAYEHFAICEKEREWDFETASKYLIGSDAADSSPGFPWSTAHSSKKEVLECADCCEKIKTWIDNLGTDRVSSCFFALSLKDEILKASKVAEGRTRLFMTCPIEHHIAMLMFCGAMHEKLMNDRGTWCSAGREFQHGGWHEMVSKLVFDWFIGLDSEMYDMSLGRVLFSLVYRNIAKYCPARVAELEDLFSMALHAFIVTGRGDVLWKHTGNPSGWYLTLLLNTMVNYILLAFAWVRKYPNSTREEFETAVRAWLCGDDSWLSVRKDVQLDYNSAWLVHCFGTLGVKIKQVHESTNVCDIEYCGAFTKMLEGRYCRVPRVEKFLNALGFTRWADPQYRLVRAVAIYHEMWTVQEKKLVRDYIAWLVERYPFLAAVRRQVMLSDQKLRYLHLGLE